MRLRRGLSRGLGERRRACPQKHVRGAFLVLNARARLRGLVGLVVIAALHDDEGIAIHTVNKAMLAVDAARPMARKVTL